jgi:protein-S-isoprenylcysteine O-methyltransferase Ste14
MLQTLANFLGLAITWGVWIALIVSEPLSPPINQIVIYGGTLASVPLVYAGRWLLDRQPDVAHAERVTVFIHYAIATLFGSAAIEAARLAVSISLLPIPAARWIGLAIMGISGVLLIVVVFNLIVKGLGLPFAIALTRRVASDWLYAWTRNPMVLAALAFLLGVGLWIQSDLFLIWLLAVASPAIFIFLKIYEERELEIRFGENYLRYKKATPMFLPRRPRM